jgi:thymidine kinase
MYGTLTVITGPMFCGKTTELLRRYDRKVHAKVPCLLVTHGIDTRYSKNQVVTHLNTYGLHTNGQAVSYKTIAEFIQGEGLIESIYINTVFIDEIQFFSDKHVCLDLLKVGINVVVAGLNGDFRRIMFPGMDALFASASNIVMLTSVCGRCQLDAPFTTKYKDEAHLTGVQSAFDVGGSDKYVPTCLQCWLHYYEDC